MEEQRKTNQKRSQKGWQRFLFLALMAVCSTMAMAQGKVSGTVVDAQGEPVIGASVVVKGTSTGTVTDFDGNFTIQNVPQNATLVFSYVGYRTQNIAVGGKSQFNVTLEEDKQLLDEVVVVGYGVQRKSDVTGALTRVGEKELNTKPVSNAFEALQGKAAGVDITTSERPGTVGSISIRGTRSISASSAPLYVVDGVPLQAGGIETLNPRDIESIDILKDASSTAIYGSRGANGVVLVTTSVVRRVRCSSPIMAHSPSRRLSTRVLPCRPATISLGAAGHTITLLPTSTPLVISPIRNRIRPSLPVMRQPLTM